jgi:enoyl-CoA hydratase/carnithine racemase
VIETKRVVPHRTASRACGDPFRGTVVVEIQHWRFLLASVIVASEGATFHDVPHFAGGIVPGDGIFTTWSYRAGAGRAEAFLLNPQPLTAAIAHQWGVVAEVVPNGKALSRAQELAEQYLKAPEVTRRNTRIHFMQPLKERIVREVGYGLSLEGASAADLVKSMQAKS